MLLFGKIKVNIVLNKYLVKKLNDSSILSIDKDGGCKIYFSINKMLNICY